MLRSYLFASLLGFLGIVISILSTMVEDKGRKWLFMIFGVIVLLIAGFWTGYEMGIRENKDTVEKIESLGKDKSETLANLRIKEQEIKTLKGKLDEMQQNKIELVKCNEQVNILEKQIKSKNDEINNLEQKIIILNQQSKQSKIEPGQDKSESSSKGRSFALQGEAKRKPFFENNILKIEVVSFGEFGPYFNLALKHTNKTQQPILIRAFEHSQDTFLIDGGNVQYNYIPPYQAGRSNELTLSDRGSNIELVPGTPKVISFQFACSTKSYGKIFSFSSKYGYCINQGIAPLPHSPIYVSIKDIKLD